MQCREGAEKAKVPLGELPQGEQPRQEGDTAGPSAVIAPFPEPACLCTVVRCGLFVLESHTNGLPLCVPVSGCERCAVRDGSPFLSLLFCGVSNSDMSKKRGIGLIKSGYLQNREYHTILLLLRRKKNKSERKRKKNTSI